MATPAVPEGFVSLILRCAIVGIIPITLGFNQLISKTIRPTPAGAVWPPFFALALAGLAWQAIVSLWVPEPYLDEIFHIPQAQQYCDGHWLAWDDKITTPPGLYSFSVAAHRLWWLLLGGCSPLTLRMTNWLVIVTVPIVASQCRRLLETRPIEPTAAPHRSRSSSPPPSQQQQPSALSVYALHSGLNIAFFPLLFFFSGLYYTDVLSTLVVLAAFWHTLVRTNDVQQQYAPRRRRQAQGAHSWRSDGLVVVLGVAALLMRQTNVFWVVVFMGGLEAVHAAGALRPPPTRPGAFDRPTKIKYYLSKYSQGEIHDPPLDAVSLDDIFYCALSIAIAVICNPLRVLRQIWAHILTMVLFAAFVLWNGGVVLGDKSNHVATIHLPQMLYIWPLFAFFSAPLLLPAALQPILTWLFGPSPPSSSSSSSKATGVAAASASASTSTPSTLSKVLNITGYAALIPTALAIVHFNTIIHPFTLADNRHYMFYVFRYSILRAPWVRYALVPIYLVSGVLCLKTLGGTSSASSSSPETRRKPAPGSRSSSSRSSSSDTSKITNGAVRSENETSNANNNNRSSSSSSTERSTLTCAVTSTTTLPPTLSTTLLFLLTTTLSLMTAPLVEPRYFLLPWVFWRLLLPSWSPSSPFRQQDHSSSSSSSSSNIDPRLWLETAWFGVINVATMYIFITRPFRWASEEGWQRFMW